MSAAAGTEAEGAGLPAGLPPLARSPCYQKVAGEAEARLGGAPVLLAVWLTAESRDALLAHAPPKYGNLHADHATLLYCPADSQLPSGGGGLAIGGEVDVLCGEAASDKVVQAVPVALGDDLLALCKNTVPHVTVSVGPGGAAAQSNALLEREGASAAGAGLRLRGVVGLAVETRAPAEDPFVDPEVRAKVDALLEVREPGSSVAMPPTLTAPQRAVLHGFASQNGLKSFSQGKKNAGRFITLTVPGEDDAPSKGTAFAASAALIVDPATYAVWLASRASLAPAGAEEGS